MKRQKALILITMIVLTVIVLLSGMLEVYADTKSLCETEKDDGIVYKYTTHVKGETYVVYTKKNEIGDLYFYLATVKNGKLNTIGEIDEMIGGNNEPTMYDVEGMTQYQADHFYVMGMVQMDGEVYIAKKRHLYRLEGDKLVEFDLKFQGKPWSIENLTGTTVIGKLTTNGDALFMTMSAVGIYLTADSENLFRTPLDGQVMRIDKDGNLTFTYTYVPTHFALDGFSTTTMKHVDFAVNSSEDRLTYEFRLTGKEMLKTVSLGETLPEAVNAGVDDRYEECHLKVMYVGDQLYSYRNNYKDGSIDILKINLDKFIPYRDKRIYSGAWQCTTREIDKIKDMYYINGWSLGDDGYIYAAVATDRLASEYKCAIYRIKP